VETSATVSPDDPLFQGLDVTLSEPLRITGQLSSAGPDSYFWRGALATTVSGTCRRCLAAASEHVEVPVNILFTEDDQADDPSVYVIPPHSTTLDLSDAVREEFILGVPGYVLCREDCAGLCPHCGKDLNEGPHDCAAKPADPRWEALEALKRRDTKH
jgi:uncharacterized protein